jgi:1-aminocyclopropane-1-carboxylate deaminase/D-cysteine desulfhydrase-like pyridoxal-dependent ACC family enzyme
VGLSLGRGGVGQRRNACRAGDWSGTTAPDVELIGVTVSRSVADQKPKVVTLQQEIAQLLEVKASAEITLG